MASIKNLKIKLQTGSDNTHYASWEFNEETRTTTSSVFKAGDLVSIKAGATYYNGAHIPDWVKNQRWYLMQVKGARAVLGANESRTNNIESAINVNSITGGSTSTEVISANTLDHYEVKWYYDTGDGIWFSGSSGDTTDKYSTYGPPDNARRIRITVKPVSKTYKVGDNDTSYWTGTTSAAEYSVSVNPPEDITSLNVDIKEYTLTATVENIEDARTDEVQFEVYNGTSKFNSGIVTVLTQRAIYTCKVTAGGKYRVRCRAINLNGSSRVYGNWSSYSSEQVTIPTAVTGVSCRADSKTSVKVSWTACETATEYTVEYTTKKEYFDSSSQVSSMSVTNSTAYVTGLESGKEWFFRVRSSNEKGESGWSEIVSSVIGTKPEPPTTWSLTTTVIVGDEVTLYWVHNSEDGSKQTEAKIELKINGIIDYIVIPAEVTEEDEEETTYYYTFNPSEYGEGALIYWRVQTKGITDEYSEWSTQRTIELFAPPTVTFSLSTTDAGVLETLPLAIGAQTGPNTQTPLSYHVSVKADNSYESDDVVGNKILITAGSEVYSRVFNTSEKTLVLSLSGGDLLLENGQSYTVTVTASMNSGLTATQSSQFVVNWEEQTYIPDASIAIDYDTLSAYITPFCVDDTGELPQTLTLAVYRREYDGSFTELATGLSNTRVTTITDSHPALDYARYRIVAQHITTSNISYEDLPGYPIKETSIVIQWDEQWTEFDYSESSEPETPPWVGSMLKLRYNVSVSENHDPDVSLVEYVGREHPVGYYGTQRGETASWSTDIPASDKETIYALRRLAKWNGDVYVREPSGVGYWAQITVSMTNNRKELTIPVTFDITRVEGDA